MSKIFVLRHNDAYTLAPPTERIFKMAVVPFNILPDFNLNFTFVKAAYLTIPYHTILYHYQYWTYKVQKFVFCVGKFYDFNADACT